MKNLLLFAALLIGLVAFKPPNVEGQISPPHGFFATSRGVNNGSVQDTVTTAPKIQTVNTSGYWDQFIVQVNLTKISGTPGGSLKIMAGIDGVNYPYLAAQDTLILANKPAQFKVWSLGTSTFPYYEVIYTPTGTQAVKMQTLYYTRRRSSSTAY